MTCHITLPVPPSLLIPLPGRNWHVTPPPFPPSIHPRPHPCISQQPPGHEYKPQHHDLILGRVPLETSSHDLVLLLALAETITQAELAVAVVAALLARAGAQLQQAGFGGGGGGVEGDDGAVAEAGAFAEGGRCCCEGEREEGEEGQDGEQVPTHGCGGRGVVWLRNGSGSGSGCGARR
ncbi:hypothetical protein B5807_00715 [Epicoccum nigrum]|uniref:Uncharacterized protein n=1 Tax=Epicoccum nigrum TaxID=105696 RepID=A0A1Y2MES6_EPING|nr:hypothetical protein B5807_00715 [Epicoccum nigrum]